jgi:penicillin-binding protein 2
VQLAIGQKDLEATPLQMARFYALVANGGKLVTPHLVADVEHGGPGRGAVSSPLVLRSFGRAPRELNIDAAALQVVRDGLYGATHSTAGTSAVVFGSFPIPIAGKTGTAEKLVTIGDFTTLTKTSWWCGYGPFDKPELVVCAVIENGGFGAEAAAPAALKVFERYFGKQAAGPVATAKAD